MSTAFSTEKIAVLAPMPRASVSAATTVKPGRRSRARTPKRRSWRKMSMLSLGSAPEAMAAARAARRSRISTSHCRGALASASATSARSFEMRAPRPPPSCVVGARRARSRSSRRRSVRGSSAEKSAASRDRARSKRERRCRHATPGSLRRSLLCARRTTLASRWSSSSSARRPKAVMR